MTLDWKSAYAAMHAQGEAAFPPAALHYLLQLNKLASLSRESRAVTAEELVQDFRRQSQRDFGPMKRKVLEEWGMNTSEELGRAVVLLGNHSCLTLDPTDTVEAFAAAGSEL